MPVTMDSTELGDSSDEIFSCVNRPYRPPSYADFVGNESSYFHKCIECGDRYFLESSLSIHLARESVAITYFCQKCGKNLHYRNKCTFLHHLREHPVKNRQEISVVVRPLTDNADSEKTSKDVNGIKKTNGGDVIGIVNPSKGFSSAEVNKGFITVSKMAENHVQFPKCNVKLISTSAKSGEVKVVIRSQPQPNLSVAGQNFICKECGVSNENIKLHFLEDNKPSNSRLRCSSCDLVLPTKCSLKSHLRIHYKRPPFVCPDCMKEFAIYELLMVHLKYICFHLEKCCKYRCQACPAEFPFPSGLEVHLASKHVKRVFKCMACPRAFFEVKMLYDHKLQCHGETKVPTKFFEQCQLCPQKLLTKSCLYIHIHEHVMNKNSCFYCYKCSRCGFSSENKQQFAIHRLSCSDPKNDVNSLDLAKLANENLITDAFDKCDSMTEVKMPLTVCLPNSFLPLASMSNTSSNAISTTNSNINALNGKFKESSNASSTIEGNTLSPRNKTFSSLSNWESQRIASPIEDKRTQSIIPQKVYKACGWHPRKCLMCRNEVAVGTLKAWQNIPANYEGCHKWKLGSINGSSFNSLKILPPGLAGRKSMRKNCMALNAPSYAAKLSKVIPVPSTYLCHICKHSLQIDHRIIQRHFRQQHPDVEIMSLVPKVRKLDFSKSNVPLQLLRFSVKPSKVIQVMINRSAANRGQTVRKKKVPLGRSKMVKSGMKLVGNSKPWFKCKECSFKTKNNKMYKRHINSHKKSGYKCKKCNLEFVSEPSRRIHVVMHHGTVGREKVQNGDIKEHMDKEHIQESRDAIATDGLKCKVCHKSFELLSDLQKHFRIHGMAFLLLNKDETVWRKV